MARDAKSDPVGVCRFAVEIDGLQVAGFSEVSGLEVEMETKQVKEGGLNNFIHNLPVRVKYKNLVLKKGFSVGSELLEWFNECVESGIKRKNGAIILYDMEGNTVARWIFLSAYPIKCTWSALNAKGAQEVAIETVELVHSGIRIRQGSS